jgi:hypothetical protein
MHWSAKPTEWRSASCAAPRSGRDECGERGRTRRYRRCLGRPLLRLSGKFYARPARRWDGELRAWMEPRFGHDLAAVRVHTDAVAARSARAVNALAYTAGEHLVFADGQYRPATDSGRALLAHELAHVVQGPRGRVCRACCAASPVGRIARMGSTALRTTHAWRWPRSDSRAAEIAANAAALLGAQPPAAETLARLRSALWATARSARRFPEPAHRPRAARPRHRARRKSYEFLLAVIRWSRDCWRSRSSTSCAGDPASIARARVPNCEAFAWSRRGSGSMVLCPGFWDEIADDDSPLGRRPARVGAHPLGPQQPPRARRNPRPDGGGSGAVPT